MDKDKSVEVVVIGILCLLVLLAGTPVFGRFISANHQEQSLKIVRESPVHSEDILEGTNNNSGNSF